jgi:hypothetical protein
MGEYETYIEEQEKRLKELESKIDIVKNRAGMVNDAQERAMMREQLTELSARMKLYTETVEELRDAGSVWEEVKDGVEKAYGNVEESLRKSSGGLVK